MSTTFYPCTSCGARLEFAPGQHALKCPYCATENQIARAEAPAVAAAVQELDYNVYLSQAAGQEALIERQTVKCPGCGAASQLAQNLTADRCPFCAAPLIAANATRERVIQPRAIAPFVIKDAQARASFKKWISGLWFAPNALKRSYREASGLKGIYLPYWTYDSNSDTPYTGERGDHYYTTERYTSNGETRTRQVRHTRWSSASGSVSVRFDDVTVPATNSLPVNYLMQLEPWNLRALQPYRDDYVAGFTVEAYQTGLQAGFTLARASMEETIRREIRSDIGGDEQRIHSMYPNFYAITFKHILLPIWLSSYQYDGKTWRFLVNGQTGEVQGERPWSAWKIAGAVVLVLILVALGVIYGDQ